MVLEIESLNETPSVDSKEVGEGVGDWELVAASGSEALAASTRAAHALSTLTHS